MHAPISKRTLSQLKWRCRRGMLENDLLIQRFFERHSDAITEPLTAALLSLMDLPDNDLLDLLLRRREPEGELDRGAVHDALRLMRVPQRPGALSNQEP